MTKDIRIELTRLELMEALETLRKRAEADEIPEIESIYSSALTYLEIFDHDPNAGDVFADYVSVEGTTKQRDLIEHTKIRLMEKGVI